MTTIPSEQPFDVAAEIALALQAYRRDDNLGVFLDRLRGLARSTTPDALTDAAEPYRDVPEVVIPLYEQVVAARPDDARAMVVLANAYWLSGRGPDTVGELASRAMSVDPSNRAAWHLWALTESRVRELLSQRDAIYRSTAQAVVDTTDLSKEAVADRVVHLYRSLAA